MEKEKKYFKEYYRKLKNETKNFIIPKKRKYIELRKRFTNSINSLKYYRELKKKINFNFIVILSVSIIIFYYLFKDAIISIINNIVSNFNNKYSLQLNFELFNKIPNIFYIILIFYFIIFCKNHITSKNINIIDKIIIPMTIFSLISTFTIDIRILILFIILSIPLIARFLLYNKANKLKENYKNNTRINQKMYTINDVFYNNFNSDTYNKILIDDNYDDNNFDIFDIFGLRRTREELKESILASKNYKEGFSIGVVGEWGSGKSTIIDLTKKEKEFRNDFIIIDDFDPWAIKSQDALILAMYNTIIENLGENVSYLKRKKVQKALINITTNIPYIGKGIGNYFENRIDDYSEYKEIKSDLEEKLEKSDKRLIFIIDNLDRMNSENVLFLLTLIGTLFKLPNVSYITAYDRKRLKNIFKIDDINPKYLEKIINKEIFMPTLHKATLEVCLENLINIYNYNDIKYKKIIKEICKQFTNIRQFICFCNSLERKPEIFDDLKNKIGYYLDIEFDYFIIQSIKFFDYNIYIKIFEYRDIILEHIGQQDFDWFLNDNFKDCYYLVKLLFSDTTLKSKEYSILDTTLFTMCFLDIDKNIGKAIDFIYELESNFKEYRRRESELKSQNNIRDLNDLKNVEDFFQKNMILQYFSISDIPSIYDITNSFSLINFLIKFKNITFNQKEILWNLLTDCTAYNKDGLYSHLIMPNIELKNCLDNNIKTILQSIFYNFDENELKTFTQNQLNGFKKSKKEYCEKLFIYEWVFKYKPSNEFHVFMNELYKPIIDNVVFLWNKEKRQIFFINLSLRLNHSEEKITKYIFSLYKKIEQNGEHLYDFIDLFIINQSMYKYINYTKGSSNVLTVKELYDLIEKHPPKDELEKKVKRDFEERYSKK